MNKQDNKLTPEERAERHRAAMRKYYYANKGKFRRYYQGNKKTRLAYDKMYREINRDAYLLKQKIYNDTKRKQQ